MTVKTTGAEFNRFYADKTVWTEDLWHDNELISVDGSLVDDLDDLPPDSKVMIQGGDVYNVAREDRFVCSFETLFKRWRKAQTVATLVIKMPKDKVAALKLHIKAVGGKVV